MSPTARRILLSVCLLLAGLAGPAQAQRAGEGRAQYNQGVKAYEEGRYEASIKNFERAYELTRKTAILFNIARAHGKLGHDEIAIGYLKQYLVLTPGAPDEAAVRAEIEAHERAIEQAKSEALTAEAQRRSAAEAEQERQKAEQERQKAELERQKAQIAAEKAHAAELERQRAVDDKHKARKSHPSLWTSYVAIAGGAVVLLAGGAMSILAGIRSSEIENGSGAFDSAKEMQGIDAMWASWAFYAIGGAALITGVGLMVWMRRPLPDSTATAVRQAWIAPNLGGLAAGGRF